MTNPVIHWEIAAQDRQKTQDFFEGLFGWQGEDFEEMNYRIYPPREEEHAIGGGLFQADDNNPPYLTFYIAVDDIDDTVKRAEALGSNVLYPVQDVSGVGRLTAITDPDGNRIGLIQPEPRQ